MWKEDGYQPDWYAAQLRNWWKGAKKGLKSFDNCHSPEEARKAAERWLEVGYKRFNAIITQLENE